MAILLLILALLAQEQAPRNTSNDLTVVPPINDECTGALIIPVSASLTCSTTISATLVDATQTPTGQNCFFSVDADFDNDVWFQFTALETRHTVEISNTQGSTSDLIFEAFSGSCAMLSQLDCHDDPNDQWLLTGLSVSSTYYLRIASFDPAPQTTTFDICVRSAPPSPPNDECLAASVVTISSPACENKVSGSFLGASESSNPETCDFGIPFYNDIWFTFTATETTHELEISNIQNAPEELIFQVSSGSCGSLNEVACISSLDGPSPYSLMGLTVGLDYFVRISTYDMQARATTLDVCIKGTALPCDLLVTSNAGTGPGTLRDAVDCSSAGDTIRFDASVYNSTIQLATPAIVILHPLVFFADINDAIVLGNLNVNNSEVLISIQNDLEIAGLTLNGQTAESLILKVEPSGGIEFTDAEIDKATIDN